MNAFLPLFLCVLCLCPALFAQTAIFLDLPGSDDESKIANIQRAVAQLRHYLAGQACFASNFPSPGDADAINRWTAWLCSYFGGPSGTVPECQWFTQPGDNSTFINDTDNLALELSFKHDQVDISQESFDFFVEFMTRALIGTGTVPPSLHDDIVEALSNLTLVNDPTGECATADLTIQWKLPTSTIFDDSVAIDGLVTWVWADDAEHSIKPDVGETTVFVGFGSNDQTLTRNTTCLSASAGFPDGGTPCNLGEVGTFSYSRYFLNDATVNYHCGVHALLQGTLTVGSGGSGTGTVTGTNPADVTDNADGGNDGGDGSSAARISSWLL